MLGVYEIGATVVLIIEKHTQDDNNSFYSPHKKVSIYNCEDHFNFENKFSGYMKSVEVAVKFPSISSTSFPRKLVTVTLVV